MAQTIALNHERNKTRKELFSLTKLQLIKKCKAANLPITGNKSEMIDRLLGYNGSVHHKNNASSLPPKPKLSLSTLSKSNKKPRPHLRLNPRKSTNPSNTDRNAPTKMKKFKSYSPSRASTNIQFNRPKPRQSSKPRSKSTKTKKSSRKRSRKKSRFNSRIAANYEQEGDQVLVIGSHAFREFGMSQDKTLITLTSLSPLIPKDTKKNIKKVYSGYYYSYYTDDDMKEVWSAGYNLHGELGCGKTGNLILPLTSVTFFNNNGIGINKLCVNVASWTIFWITDDYKLYGNGMNDDYQLGLGPNDTEHYFTPILIKQLCDIPIIDVQCAHKYSIVLSGLNKDILLRILGHWLKNLNIHSGYNGNRLNIIRLLQTTMKEIMDVIMTYCDRKRSVWSTGFSEYGGSGFCKKQLQDRDREEMGVWKQIDGLNDAEITKIATGYEHSIFLQENGELLSCGHNDWGQLGIIGMTDGNDNELQNGNFNGKEIYYDIQMDSIHVPMEIGLRRKVIDIKCGMYHNLCIDNSNNIYSWGQGKFGQCGHKEVMDRYYEPTLIQWFTDLGHKIDTIDTGNYHSYCRGTNGLHFVFGSNKYNQCLDKKKQNLFVPWCINHKVEKKWKHKRIKNVFLGFDNTKIIVEDRQ